MSLLEVASKSPTANAGDLTPSTPADVIDEALAKQLAHMLKWAEQPGNHVTIAEKDPTSILLEKGFGITAEEAKELVPTKSTTSIPLHKVLRRQ